jgi:hypothetical protein
MFGEDLDVEAEASCQGLELKIVAVLARLLHALDILVKGAIDICGIWWRFIDIAYGVAAGSGVVATVSVTGPDGDEIFELIAEASQVLAGLTTHTSVFILGSK